MPPIATQDQAAQEQAVQEQTYAQELAAAMAAEQEAQQRARVQEARVARQAAVMQQAAAALQAQQGEGGFSDKQYRQMAKQLTKQYRIRIESLKKDLDMEWGAFGSPFFFPIMMTLLSISAVIDVINLGSWWTIVNLIIFITMPIVRIHRAWTKANIMYSSAERQVKRRVIIYERQIWKTTKRTLASSVEAVPGLNIIPVWPALTLFDKLDEWRHQQKLKQLKEKVRSAEQRVNRLTVRARSGPAQYQLAFLAMQTAKSLDDEFLKA